MRNIRDVLKEMQRVADADEYQTEAMAFRHAMSMPDQSLYNARRASNCFVTQQMQGAMRLKRDGKIMAALRQMGLALHTVQDATSPAHWPFQPWHSPSSVKTSYLAYEHVQAEDFDPGVGSNLDRVTLWMWQVFSGDVPFPDDFFAEVRPDARPSR